MPTVILLFGGFLGILIGALLAGGMVAVAGLPVYGPVQNVLAALLALGPGAIVPNVVNPILTLFAAGLGPLVATIFIYAAAAISVITGLTLGEFFSRGMLIGMSAAANLMILSAIPWLPPGFAIALFVILLLALIPPVAVNRTYERILGALGWVLPLNYLMLPVGLLLFLIAAPFAIAAPAPSGVRWDWLTWTFETSGGLVLVTFVPGPAGKKPSFNIGNFTFLPGAPSGFTSGVSAHETGHTLSGSAFGGFFYWIGAVDENVPPLARGTAAYSEMLANSHFGGIPGQPIIPMW